MCDHISSASRLTDHGKIEEWLEGELSDSELRLSDLYSRAVAVVHDKCLRRTLNGMASAGRLRSDAPHQTIQLVR